MFLISNLYIVLFSCDIFMHKKYIYSNYIKENIFFFLFTDSLLKLSLILWLIKMCDKIKIVLTFFFLYSQTPVN
jgi:hypothetical protein